MIELVKAKTNIKVSNIKVSNIKVSFQQVSFQHRYFMDLINDNDIRHLENVIYNNKNSVYLYLVMVIDIEEMKAVNRLNVGQQSNIEETPKVGRGWGRGSSGRRSNIIIHLFGIYMVWGKRFHKSFIAFLINCFDSCFTSLYIHLNIINTIWKMGGRN